MEQPHLLVVDDDARIRSLLQRYLTANGFRVTVAAHAGEARALMKSMAFDLLIVDVMMPGETGMEFTKSIRAHDQTPILMLTAMGEAEHRIAGLETGADDYLPKPFEPRELLARIRAILRRRTEGAPPPVKTMRFGSLEIDRDARIVTVAGKPCELTSYQFDLLV
ncbi:MAG TPA: response regulator transcription factor, partial [Rhizomicrobium sp.]